MCQSRNLTSAAAIWVLSSSAALGLALGACSGPAKAPPTPEACPEGYLAAGSACAPVFDACEGPTEVPVLGGGCQTVGVTACATGLVSDGEGGCEAILPAAPCAAGQREQLGATACQPVGVLACATGFVADGEGGCEAVLPETVCPDGTLELLGSEVCEPLDECGAGTWGDLVIEAGAVHVDVAYGGGDADGSATRPYPSLSEGLLAAGDGGQVVVAAGTYAERVVLTRPVQLVGRCASMVVVQGQSLAGTARPALTVNAGAASSTLQGLTLTGPGEGLVVAGATLSVTAVQVLDTGGMGVSLAERAEVVARRTVVSRATAVGVLVEDATLDLADSVIEDTRAAANQSLGRGVEATCSDTGCAQVVLQRSVVQANRDLGVHASGAGVQIRSSVIRDTRPRAVDSAYGVGVLSWCSAELGCADLQMEDTLVSGNRDTGVLVWSAATATLQRVTIRDTASTEYDGTSGYGIFAICDEVAGCGTVSLIQSSVRRNQAMGIYARGVTLGLEGTQVVDTSPQTGNGALGWGLGADCDAALGVCGDVTLTDSLVSGSVGTGVAVAGPRLRLLRSVVRDTAPAIDVDQWGPGWGVDATCAASIDTCGDVAIVESLVLRNHDFGVSLMGPSAEVRASVIAETQQEPVSRRGGAGLGLDYDTVGRGGDLLLDGSLLRDNASTGLWIIGPGTTRVVQTTVRDTAPDADGKFGEALAGYCDAGGMAGFACGRLEVEDSVFRGARLIGIDVYGPDLRLVRSLVRDTDVQTLSGQGGFGLVGACDVSLAVCPTLELEDVRIVGSHAAGVFLAGVRTTASGLHVQGTLPASGDHGLGIIAGCEPAVADCGSLLLEASTIRENERTGLRIEGTPLVVRGVEVVDVVANRGGHNPGEGGGGIVCVCFTSADGTRQECGSCQVELSRIAWVETVGLALDGPSGALIRSVVEQVWPQPLDQHYGYGVQASAPEGATPGICHVQGAQIMEADLAGILYGRATGTVSGTVVAGADFSVVWGIPDLHPTLGEGNVLQGTLRSEPSLQTALDPAPAPPPPTVPAPPQ